MALALPAGLLARRSGRTFGFLAGICLCFLYWTLLTVGETTSLRAGFAPALPGVAAERRRAGGRRRDSPC